ncbi:hypothetical protein CS063_14830 [Sporanaerobium hydrogeniformans]|uniref:Uncharacterized protein n=1 Tax=Sporanaerobium hydrogeniformans TaxID=3072179 RepID=A0AC61D997_9FIRM|nr:spore coat associated protein CotJA [Sporanaerobium hydrogeniformans]PHV69633.1 hypothetical protein CS063_14830 [Sporanaerobium hydrogeniformans]
MINRRQSYYNRPTPNENMGMNIMPSSYSNNYANEEIQELPIAMAYVPWQQWKDLYEPKEAFKRGTLFKQLDLPFYGGKGTKACQ